MDLRGGALPRAVLGVTGLLMLICAAVIWIPAPSPTVQTTTERTTQRTIAPPTQNKRNIASRTTVTSTSKTTQLINGAAKDAEKAKPAPSRRPDGLAIALIASGALLIALACVGPPPARLPV
jgi:hypothetical protein